MIFSYEQTISYLSTIVPLERGDVIYTGTPEGVGSVVEGDVLEAELVGYARISHRIRFARN
jgi:fumarylpyruvate hydrolase